MSRKKRKSRSSPWQGKTGPSGPAGPKRKDRKPPASSPAEEPAHPPLWSAAGTREVIESVVIAFVLAFLFRTFEAEAFVIPTGSMAPTLMGRHKDVECPKCGYRFEVSASDEINSRSGHRTNEVVIAGTCPMCRYTMDFRPGNPQGESYRSYKGDRILVTKFAYRATDPERWDVAVFKFPGGAQTNFIKRIVGLPNETICISHGDLYVKPAEDDDFVRFGEPHFQQHGSIDLAKFHIARKLPAKIRAMLQPVHDSDRVPPQFDEAGWPARWQPMAGSDADGGWETADKSRSFHTRGSAPGETWISYRHIVPSYRDWLDLDRGVMPADNPDPQPQLITDFSAYNTDVKASSHSGLGGIENIPHWVGDLALDCVLDVESTGGEALFRLIEGGRTFDCRIDLATGKATLAIDELETYRPTANTRLRKPGTYRIMFANVDDCLVLWVDGKEVRFDEQTGYHPLDNTQPKVADLEPVRIGSRGAALKVRHLKVYRDVYYIAQRPKAGAHPGEPLTDFIEHPYYRYGEPERVTEVLSDPREWGAFKKRQSVAFPLDDDQFLVLGDNSPESKDSRLWESEKYPHYVSRELLMGKALFIYWPHSLDTIPGTNGIPVRFFPNFWRMHFVR